MFSLNVVNYDDELWNDGFRNMFGVRGVCNTLNPETRNKVSIKQIQT